MDYLIYLILLLIVYVLTFKEKRETNIIKRQRDSTLEMVAGKLILKDK